MNALQQKRNDKLATLADDKAKATQAKMLRHMMAHNPDLLGTVNKQQEGALRKNEVVAKVSIDEPKKNKVKSPSTVKAYMRLYFATAKHVVISQVLLPLEYNDEGKPLPQRKGPYTGRAFSTMCEAYTYASDTLATNDNRQYFCNELVDGEPLGRLYPVDTVVQADNVGSQSTYATRWIDLPEPDAADDQPYVNVLADEHKRTGKAYPTVEHTGPITPMGSDDAYLKYGRQAKR